MNIGKHIKHFRYYSQAYSFLFGVFSCLLVMHSILNNVTITYSSDCTLVAKAPVVPKPKINQSPSIKHIGGEVKAKKTANTSTHIEPMIYILDVFEPKNKGERAAQTFIKKYFWDIIATRGTQPASVKMAQAILESDKGRSRLTKTSNNFFCIKFRGYNKYSNSKHSYFDKVEKDEDDYYVYDRPTESFEHHRVFLEGDRYKDCHDSTIPEDWCDCLQEKGYATDKNYAKKLKSVIEKYHLKDLDKY